MEDLDRGACLVYLIINSNRGMKQAPNVLALVDAYAQMWEHPKNFAVVQKASPKPRSRVWIVNSDTVQDLPEIA